MDEIRIKIGDTSPIWACVDETTDRHGSCAANLLVGKLESNRYYPPHLVSVKFLEKTNHSTVAKFVNEGLSKYLCT